MVPPLGARGQPLRPPTLDGAPMLANGAGGRAGSMVPPLGAIGQLTLLGAGQWPCARPRWMERQCWPMALGECCEHGAASRRQGPALALHATWAGARPAPDSWWNPERVSLL